MKQMALQYFSHSSLTLLAFMLFFSSFMLVIFKIYLLDTNQKYKELSQIPFSEEESKDD